MAKINMKLQETVRPHKRPNLPKAAVNILTRWLEENCTNPYPSESTKKILMEITNLTKNQVIFNETSLILLIILSIDITF